MVSFGIAAVYGAKPTCGVPRSDGVLVICLSALCDNELEIRQIQQTAEKCTQCRHGLIDGRERAAVDVFIKSVIHYNHSAFIDRKGNSFCVFGFFVQVLSESSLCFFVGLVFLDGVAALRSSDAVCGGCCAGEGEDCDGDGDDGFDKVHIRSSLIMNTYFTEHIITSDRKS